MNQLTNELNFYMMGLRYIKMSVFLLLILFIIIRVDAELKIIKQEMNEEMKYQALGLYVNEVLDHHNYTLITKAMVKLFNADYGPQWQCIVGPVGFETNINATSKTLLWFTYNSTQVILYKLNQPKV